MRFHESLANTTSAAGSDHFDVSDGNPVTIVIKGSPAGAEIHDLQIATDDSITPNYMDAYFEGAQITLEAGETTIITVRGPGRYRINKAATASAVGFVAESAM